MGNHPVPEWLNLTLKNGDETLVPITAVKRIDIHPDGCSIYVDKEPFVVKETFEELHGKLAEHEYGGYSKR